MKAFTKAVLAAALAVAMVPAAQAQGALQMRVSAQTDAGGATPSCLMQFRLTNGGAARISTFSAEIAAFDVRSGAQLRVPVTTIPFMGIEPGQAKDWTLGAVSGARCDQVRLQVQRMTCIRRCGPAEWTQQGLAAIEVVQR